MREIIALIDIIPYQYGDEYVKIAKGKYQLPLTIKQLTEKIKRTIKDK